jgi:hypothetical protein
MEMRERVYLRVCVLLPRLLRWLLGFRCRRLTGGANGLDRARGCDVIF